MSEIKVNKISPRSGTTLTLGDSGDDFVIPAGATLTNNGTASGFASIAWQSSIVTGTLLRLLETDIGLIQHQMLVQLHYLQQLV
jgi:hypothetical protein